MLHNIERFCVIYMYVVLCESVYSAAVLLNVASFILRCNYQ